jgi:PAS domain S-box-containing protein
VRLSGEPSSAWSAGRYQWTAKQFWKKQFCRQVLDAIIAADNVGKIFFWNPGAERIFGYSSADAVGRSLDIIIPDRLRRRHWDG